MKLKFMVNSEIAELLRAVAASYKLKDANKNKFRIIAYERAADAVEHASSELKDLWDEGKLDEIPGIGKNIASHLSEIFEKGYSKHFEEVMKGFPPQLFKLMEIPGIGAKTAYKLVSELKIGKKNPVSDLEKLAQKGEIAKLEGFGDDSQSDILASIQEVKDRPDRYILPYAHKVASEVIDWLKTNKDVLEANQLGSLRRRASTVGDIDIAVSTKYPKKVIDHFTLYKNAQRVLEKGDMTASIILPGGIQVDLMVQKPQSYGSLLQHFTGSKHHNIALREYALKKGFSLSEYGVKNLKTKSLKSTKTEKEFYESLDLKWIPPELREDKGEIKASLEGKLPSLIKLKDVKADLQIHSSFNTETSHDLGESSMEQIIKYASKLRYEYIAFTEHNPSQSGHNDDQIIRILEAKKKIVEKLNYSYVKNMKNSVIKVFNSLELDILPDGKLPISEEGLETLDFALVSVHSSFRQSKEKMTKRVLSALSHPKVKIFAHPTGRLLQKREGIELNWEKVFDFCLKNNKWLEINGDPMRLDLPDFLVKEAINKGIKLTLGTDAHASELMDNMQYAVSVARRGWAEKKDIINTLSFKDFEKALK